MNLSDSIEENLKSLSADAHKMGAQAREGSRTQACGAIELCSHSFDPKAILINPSQVIEAFD